VTRPARWALWWTPPGLHVDQLRPGADPAPPENIVEGFVVLVPTSLDDPNGARHLMRYAPAIGVVSSNGPDALGEALARSTWGLVLEAVFQPDEGRRAVKP